MVISPAAAALDVALAYSQADEALLGIYTPQQTGAYELVRVRAAVLP